MNRSTRLFDRLKQNRLIAFLAPKSAAECLTAYEVLDPLGVVLEVGLRTPAALEGIGLVLAKHPSALVMAGTVLTPDQAEAALDVGVAGVVSADYIPSVVEACLKRKIMCVPGGVGDVGKQLVQKAGILGCDLDTLRRDYPCQWIYKLFPAMAGAPDNLEAAAAWQSVYRELVIVYTGGVTAGNVGGIVGRDPSGIICGSSMTRNIDDPERMKGDVLQWLDAIHGTDRASANFLPGKPEGGPLRRAEGNLFCRRPGAYERVVTFGEIMLRLSPEPGRRFVQVDRFDALFGGAEANVAVALANLGRPSRFVTALPEHAIGQAAVNSLRAFGVDTEQIVRCGDRVGIYFLEHGASQRPSRVIYDRAGSAISAIAPGRIDWDAAFRDATWFHFSGITPALGGSAAEMTMEALVAAKRAGLTVSVDLNYREKLWPRERARAVMTPMMEHVDVIIGNEQDADDVFGIRAAASDADAGRLDMAGYEAAARELVDRFGLKMAALTLRTSLSASDNLWSACCHDGRKFVRSREYAIHIIDRVGGGDAFSAGLIHGLLSGVSVPEALEFGVAASCLKQTIHGDFSCVTEEEVLNLAGGDITGRIKR